MATSEQPQSFFVPSERSDNLSATNNYWVVQQRLTSATYQGHSCRSLMSILPVSLTGCRPSEVATEVRSSDRTSSEGAEASLVGMLRLPTFPLYSCGKPASVDDMPSVFTAIACKDHFAGMVKIAVNQKSVSTICSEKRNYRFATATWHPDQLPCELWSIPGDVMIIKLQFETSA